MDSPQDAKYGMTRAQMTEELQNIHEIQDSKKMPLLTFLHFLESLFHHRYEMGLDIFLQFLLPVLM